MSELLERALTWSDIVLERQGVIPEQWRPIYDVLIGIRNDLDKFSITPAWSLRETDLYDYQRQLDRIDEARVDGNWVDAEGNPAELYVQRVRALGAATRRNGVTDESSRHCCISSGEATATSTISWCWQSLSRRHFCRSIISFRP